MLVVKSNHLNHYGFDAISLCVVPSYSKVGISTAKALQKCVDIVFEQGELYDSVVRK